MSSEDGSGGEPCERGRREKAAGRRVARGGCVAAHARGLVTDREVCVTDQSYSIFLLLPRGAGSICGKLGAFLSTGVLL
jgi:hypothetical protein